MLRIGRRPGLVTLARLIGKTLQPLRIGRRPGLVTLADDEIPPTEVLRIGRRPGLVTLRGRSVCCRACVADWSQAGIGYTAF